VGQGEIEWGDCAKSAHLRDRVIEKQPKDEAGWPKTMSADEEARFLETLSEEEQHCVVGLGGSQKAEVAWMEANGIAFERHDVEKFFADMSDSERKSADIFLVKHSSHPKQKRQLRKVLRETRVVLQERVAAGTRIAVTSFRKGSVNTNHEFLHQVRSCLSLHPPDPEHQVGYVHFQSGFENSLFGWRSGSDECDYGVEKYYDLNIELYWYIEWLEIVNQCAAGGGYLIVFDLSGEAAMSTSINCAMELSILYQLYVKGDRSLVLVVLNDDDAVPNNVASLAATLLAKTQDQKTQAALFKKAYEKCYTFLQSHFAVTHGLHKVSRDWMRDFASAGGGPQGVRRLSVAVETEEEEESAGVSLSLVSPAFGGGIASLEDGIGQAVRIRKTGSHEHQDKIGQQGKNRQEQPGPDSWSAIKSSRSNSLFAFTNPLAGLSKEQGTPGHHAPPSTKDGTKLSVTPTSPLRRIRLFKRGTEQQNQQQNHTAPQRSSKFETTNPFFGTTGPRKEHPAQEIEL
jgi:hypothetical protein